jgi:hypothetical protein
MYRDLRDKNAVFSGMVAAVRGAVGVSWHDQAENKDAEIVSGNYFNLLGLHPALGRLFNDADDTAKNANPVAVLAYDYWKTHFNAAPDVAGKTLLINGHPFTIVGVGPEGFHSAIDGYTPGVFLPITMSETAMPWLRCGTRCAPRNCSAMAQSPRASKTTSSTRHGSSSRTTQPASCQSAPTCARLSWC